MRPCRESRRDAAETGLALFRFARYSRGTLDKGFKQFTKTFVVFEQLGMPLNANQETVVLGLDGFDNSSGERAMTRKPGATFFSD